MRFTCNHCGDIAGNCDCDLQIAAEERAAELVCEVCGNEPPFEWFDSCLKCEAAYLIHGPKWALEESRKHYGGSPAWDAMEREMARQLEAIRSVA